MLGINVVRIEPEWNVNTRGEPDRVVEAGVRIEPEWNVNTALNEITHFDRKSQD